MKRILLACLALAGPAMATNGMRMPGFGPVQDSMAGVGVGATLDAASIASNPAGLIGLPQQLVVGGAYFKPTVSYSATESPGLGGAVVAQPGAKIDSQRGASPIPALAFVAPLGDSLAAGIGLFAVSGMGVDYVPNLYSGQTYTSYMQARLSPSLAFKAIDRLALGVTVNAMVAQMNWNVASGFGQQPHDTSTSYGLGVTVGAKVAATDWLSFGASYESRSFFRDFSFTVNGGTDKLSFDQPMSATAGFAVKPLDALLVAGDVQWINWSATNGTNKPVFSQNQSQAMAWDMGWKDQWVFKLGVQVTPVEHLALRAGYNYGKMPLDAHCAFENIAFPAVSEHHISVGAGYDFGRLTVNGGGTWSPKATLTGSNPDYPQQGGQAIQSYTTEMSQISLDLGIAYRL